MKRTCSEHDWEGYLYWQKTDKKVLRRINQLLKE
ncbi:type II toxin-antitoxin system YoeB family toxin [Litchfieldella qijiaojingensis]